MTLAAGETTEVSTVGLPSLRLDRVSKAVKLKRTAWMLEC